MRRTLLSATAVGMLLSISGWGQSKHSDVGTWTVDISQSTFGSEPAPKSITLVVLKDSPQMMSYRVRVIDDKGKAFAYSWSGPADGTMHPMMQNGKEVAKQSMKREDDGTLHRHGEDPDGSSFDAYDKSSDDGKTITEEATGKAKDGKESKTKTLYRRASSPSKAAEKKPAA